MQTGQNVSLHVCEYTDPNGDPKFSQKTRCSTLNRRQDSDWFAKHSMRPTLTARTRRHTASTITWHGQWFCGRVRHTGVLSRSPGPPTGHTARYPARDKAYFTPLASKRSGTKWASPWRAASSDLPFSCMPFIYVSGFSFSINPTQRPIARGARRRSCSGHSRRLRAVRIYLFAGVYSRTADRLLESRSLG